MRRAVRFDDATGGLEAVDAVVARPSSVAIANLETVVVAFTALAGSLRVGTTLRVEAGGLFTNTTTASTSTWRIRVGPVTLLGTIPAGITSVNGTTARTNVPFRIEGLITVYSTGVTGTIRGFLVLTLTGGVAPVVATVGTAAVAVNTTVANLVEFTFVSGAASTSVTFTNAVVEVIEP